MLEMATAYHERVLLVVCLEATVSKLARSVDELEVDLLQRTATHLANQ